MQAQVNLAKYQPETAKILHRDIFWFFMKDKDFVTKTINEGNVDIQKFPATKVLTACQEDGKMESSKATAKHISTGGWRPTGSTNSTYATSTH